MGQIWLDWDKVAQNGLVTMKWNFTKMKSFIIFTVLGLKTNYITKYNNVISQTTSNRNLMTGGNFPKLFLGMFFIKMLLS